MTLCSIVHCSSIHQYSSTKAFMQLVPKKTWAILHWFLRPQYVNVKLLLFLTASLYSLLNLRIGIHHILIISFRNTSTLIRFFKVSNMVLFALSCWTWHMSNFDIWCIWTTTHEQHYADARTTANTIII